MALDSPTLLDFTASSSEQVSRAVTDSIYTVENCPDTCVHTYLLMFTLDYLILSADTLISYIHICVFSFLDLKTENQQTDW